MKRANTLQSIASGGIAQINTVKTLLKEWLYFTLSGLIGGRAGDIPTGRERTLRQKA